MKYMIRMENADASAYRIWSTLHLYVDGRLILGEWISQLRFIENKIKEYEEKI